MRLFHAPLAAAFLTTLPAFGAPLTTAQEDAPADTAAPAGGIPDCGDAPEVVLPSGIKYCEIVKGESEDAPKLGDRVRVHYTGWNLDGTEFDSSRKARRPGMEITPFEFTVGSGVIEGWSAIAQQMTVGDRWKVTIPAAMAYGETGSPPVIQPNADLIFEIEMLAITERCIGFQAWPTEAGDDVVSFESGMKLRVLKEGTGIAAPDADIAMLKFGCFNPAGSYIFGHTNQGSQLQLSKGRVPMPFFDDLMPYMKQGSVLQCNLPSTIGVGSQPGEIPGLPEGSNEIWMFDCTTVMKFTKPEFQMPADEELTTTESGLKYKIVREGNGKQPTAANSVVAHYAGWLTTGSPFDNSYDRSAPSTFPLSGVVRGWTEGLQFLKEGGAAWYVIPPDLGYGAAGRPGIPANSTLVFYVELVSVQ